MIIWFGELISSIGSGMTAFAVSIYVYQLTGSATLVSITALLAYLPTIILSPVGGVLADRYDRRLMMILGDSLSALGLLYIFIRIPNDVQGRAWGMISVLTQSGFILAYAICGVLADYVFGPMLMEDGILAGSVGRLIGTGEGRGVGFMLMIAGMMMVLFAMMVGSKKSIKEMGS